MEEKMPVPVERREMAFHRGEGAYPAVESGERAGQAGTNLFAVLTRSWKRVLVVALVVCAVGLPVIWLAVKPQYTATAAIRVDPVSKAIAFEDQASAMPFYTNYLNTSARIITSSRILNPVISDAEVQKLAYIKSVEDPLALLKDPEVFAAVADSKSQLVLVTVTTPDAQASTVIANAAVRAYMKIEGGTEATSEDEKLRTLERERDTSSEKLKTLYEASYQLSEEFGTSDLTIQQQVMLARVQELQKQVTEVQTQRLMLELQVNALKAGTASESDAMLVKLRNEAIGSDPVASFLTAEVTKMEQDVDLSSLSLAEDSRPLVEKKQRLEALRKALDSAQEKARQRFDQIQVEATTAQKEQRLKDAETLLGQFRAKESMINAEIDKQSASVVALGRKSLALRKLQDDIALTTDLYQRLTQRLQELQVERQRPARVSVAYEADAFREEKDKRGKYTAVLVIGAIVFACAFVVFQKEIDPRIDTPGEVEARCGLRVLGTTPRFKDLDKKRVKAKHFVDDCRTIRVNLMLASGDKRARSIVIASPQGRDGKTTLAINLATSIALTGRRVLLVDGDLRKPEVARYLRISNRVGLMNVLSGEVDLEAAVQPTILETLKILPSNRRAYQQSELVGGPALADIFERARALYDEIIIDTPAVLAMPDAKLWATLADGVILVARSGKTSATDLNEARVRMQQTGARILGAVVTGVRMEDSYEKYQHRYGDGYVDEPVSEDDVSATRVFLLSRTLGSDQDEEERGGRG
jgi:capsular exopolysaccharide synthesis family protein